MGENLIVVSAIPSTSIASLICTYLEAAGIATALGRRRTPSGIYTLPYTFRVFAHDPEKPTVEILWDIQGRNILLEGPKEVLLVRENGDELLYDPQQEASQRQPLRRLKLDPDNPVDKFNLEDLAREAFLAVSQMDGQKLAGKLARITCRFGQFLDPHFQEDRGPFGYEDELLLTDLTAFLV